MKKGNYTSFIGEVKTVDAQALSCDVLPLDSESVVHDVRLKATLNENQAGVVVMPKVGSYVVCLELSQEESVVVMYSEVDKFTLQNEGDTLSVIMDFAQGEISLKANKIVFNEGLKGGLIDLPKFLIEFNKVISFINTIKTMFSAWTPTPGDGGGVLKTLSQALNTLPVPQTEFEDTKVKH